MHGNKKAGGREPYINLCHNVIDMHMYKSQFNNANDVIQTRSKYLHENIIWWVYGDQYSSG